ncbi:MAG: iron-containing alcohol dehydrogenase [Christensenellales bacterium]
MAKISDNNIKFIIGEKSLENLAYEIKLAGCDRPMLVCDDMARRLGYKSILLKAFDGTDVNINYIDHLIGDVATSDDCERLVREFNKSASDCLILLGKKAVMSAGKVSKIMLCEGTMNVSDYEGRELSSIEVKKIPTFVVPTNYASGIECSNKVRIYSPDHKTIYQFDSVYAQSDAVVVDSRMTDITPPKAVASYGLYALAMAVDGYVKSGDRLYTKPYALTAIEIIQDHLVKGILQNADKDHRREIMSAVVIAGCGYYQIEKNFLAVLSDVISDRYKVNQANVMAILFRHYIERTNVNRQLLGELRICVDNDDDTSDDDVKVVVDKILSLYSEIDNVVNYNSRLSDFNIAKSDFASIAEETIAAADVQSEEFSYSFIINLLEEAY